MADITQGMSKVLENLNKEISGVKNRGIDGLLAGGYIIQADSQERVPVEHGILRSAAFTRKAMDSTPNNPAVEVGYGGAAGAYALAVHENVEEKLKGKKRPSGLGVYWGPHGESQFLLKALIAKSKAAIAAVAAYAAVGSNKR